jgi:hypothetical protein
MQNILAVRLGPNGSLLARLAEIDAKSVRPLRAILDAQAAGNAPHPLDVAALAALETESAELRSQLRP